MDLGKQLVQGNFTHIQTFHLQHLGMMCGLKRPFNSEEFGESPLRITFLHLFLRSRRDNKYMELTPLGIQGVWLAESPLWNDERGFFREWFKSEDIKNATGRDFGIEQANISLSSAGTLRGIHYSVAPRGQAKCITCVAGSIKDVIVDIRPDSESFGKWIEVELKGDSGKVLIVSESLGHGFLAQEDNTIIAYLVSTPFSPIDEFGINPLDEKIGIDWGLELSELKISEKDKSAPTLAEQLLNGKLPN
jgi:dTDP-4-dehydrorhamnose 3,5-epimerase